METMDNTSEKIEVTLQSLAPILKLDKLQLKAAVKACGAYGETAGLPRYVVLRLLLTDMLERLAFLKPSQRQAILAQYDDTIDANDPQWQTLAFADGNWCTWSGNVGWLDLDTGDTVQQLPMPPVETIGYNLDVLVARALAQIQKRLSHAEKHPAGSVDEP